MAQWAQPSKLVLSMIIVSEPSAKTTRRVDTGRSTPVYSRISMPRNEASRHVDARPISGHTEEVTGSIPVSPIQSYTMVCIVAP